MVGTLWADSSWQDRFHGISPRASSCLRRSRFCCYHFERSERGTIWVLIAFLASCGAADGSLVDRAVRARVEARRDQECRRAGQELYRPEPGIRAVHGGAGTASSSRCSNGSATLLAAGLRGAGARIFRQYGVRGVGACGLDLYPGAADRVRLHAPRPPQGIGAVCSSGLVVAAGDRSLVHLAIFAGPRIADVSVRVPGVSAE